MANFNITLEVSDKSLNALQSKLADRRAKQRVSDHITPVSILQAKVSKAVRESGLSISYLKADRIKKVSRDDEDLTINCYAQEEHVPIKGNALASGDEDLDRKTERIIRKQLADGNLWAWCTVCVSVEWNGIESEEEHLGCCSYDSRKDFIKNSGYFDEMVNTCINDLNSKLNELSKKI